MGERTLRGARLGGQSFEDERGTSWFGTFLFGFVFQVTGSYRPAIVALVVFFVLGAVFLLRLDPRRGVQEAGNAVPAAL